MIIDAQRRVFLKGSLAAGSLTLVAGLIAPNMVLAAWNTEAFQAKTEADAIKALFGGDAPETSDAITIEAPTIAENGAVVPVKISTSLKAESISIIASNNPVPLTSSFVLGEGTEAFASTRIKMGKTGNVVALIKAEGKVYSASQEVKVTIGGCGG